jgi:hypothetical protein
MLRRAALLVAAAVLGIASAAPWTLAVFGSSRVSTATFGTASVAPPTSLAGANGTLATLTWTPSVTSTATGYAILRSATSGSGYAQVGTKTPISAVTTTDNPANGVWYYILQAYVSSWTSASSNEARVVVGTPVTTAFKGCSSNAPVTVGSGDNLGYELSPGNACALDGAYAQDVNSGTNNVNSCTDTGKDRHVFWGYAFGLPGSVTAINGITVQVVVGENNTTGTTVLCAELSGDGGTTWTPAKQITLARTALTSFTLGTASDDWGHGAWSLAQLGSSTFRVRITDVATIPTKTFRLDYLGAQVTYVP